MAQISGQVVNEDGQPVEGATVSASGTKSSGQTATTSKSDPRGPGFYTITGLKDGSHQVNASHPQYTSGPPRTVLASADGVNISLWGKGPFIAGHVRDNTGRPLEAAYVTAAPDWAVDSPPPQSVWTNADGYFQLAKVEPNVKYGMTARKEGYISRDEEVRYAKAGDTNVELILHQRTPADPPEKPFRKSFDPNNPAEYPYDPVEQALLASQGVSVPPRPTPPAIPAPAPGGGMPAARLGDLTQHGGTIGPVVAAMTVLIKNQPAATLSDNHVCPNYGPGPHVGGPIMKGSTSVIINNKPAARVGDQCTCAGPPDMIAKGDPTTLIG